MVGRLIGNRILILETREEAQFSRLLADEGAEVEAEERDVELVRHPREWVPVRGLARRQRPADARPRKPTLHVGVGRHVIGIIVVDEPMPDRAREQQEGEPPVPARCASSTR